MIFHATFGRLRTRCAACIGMAVCGALAGCGVGVIPGAGSSAPLAAVATGPQLGYLWDASNQTLRPVLGTPGAAQVGLSVVPAGLYVNGAGSARSGIAVLQSADGSISTMALPNGSAQTVAGAQLGGSAQIVFSPSGTNALLLAPGAPSLLLLTGLKGSAQVQTLPAPAGLLSATVSDTAQVAAVSGSGPFTVALLTGNRGTLAMLAGFGGVNFLPAGDDLLLADSGTNVVTMIRHSSTAPAVQTFTSGLIQAPLAVAGSTDGRWAVIANGGDASAVRLDLSSATAPLRIACACRPAQLTPFMGSAVFSLLPLSATPNWVVDASAPTPRTVFIPAVTP